MFSATESKYLKKKRERMKYLYAIYLLNE